MDRTRMERLAVVVELALNWSIEASDAEQAVTITVAAEGDGRLYWYLADALDAATAFTAADLLEEAAAWAQDANAAVRQHAEEAAEERRLYDLVAREGEV